MGKISNILDKIADTLEEIPYGKMLFSVIAFIGYSLLATRIHELGHFIVARLLGYTSYTTMVTQFFGSTQVVGSINPSHLIIIAYAGPIISFIIGSYLWFLEENGLARFGAIPFWIYSTLPNLDPTVPFTDAGVAVSAGFPLTSALIIYLVVASFVAYHLFKEVMT